MERRTLHARHLPPALEGLRIGLLWASPDRVRLIEACRPTWAVSAPALAAIEVAAQWVPYLVHDLNLRFPKFAGKEARPDVLSGSSQLFVACQTDDDLPYVLKYAGDNSLMIGSDYGHADNASELLALNRLKENGALDPEVIDKILFSNPVRFYGLD